MKKPILIVCFIWTLLIAGSLSLSLITSKDNQEAIVHQSTRGYFEQIVISRAWNASHGGVYVPITVATKPNPYLDDPMREILVNKDLTLTKINPAFMTRQISELNFKKDGIQFHITSLNPLNPNNSPTELERKALESFEKGVSETGQVVSDGEEKVYFYMAPLVTESSCLKCHQVQGYKVGQIRGGISVTMPFQRDISWWAMLWGHFLLYLFGLGGILFSGIALNRAYEALKKQAVIDALTGINNRHSFSKQILTEYDISRRKNYSLSIIMIDVDFFKLYNDTYGHTAGDKCLIEIAKAIKNTLKRPADFCARYGGEEFIIILPDTEETGAVKIADDIQQNVVDLNITHSKSDIGFVSICLGISTMLERDSLSYEQLISQADNALYQAKENGRNRVEVFVSDKEDKKEGNPPDH